MIDDNISMPGTGFIDTQSLSPVDVPEAHWPAHPILSRAQLSATGNALEWPDASAEQLPLLLEITVLRNGDQIVARLAPRFNFDLFVDATFNEQQSVPQIGRVDDVQRYYLRATDNGFHVVGVFSAVTITGRRRYYQWLTSTWVEIGQSGFLHVRDDVDTHFTEVDDDQLEQYQPGATTTDVPSQSERWSMEHFEARFGAHAADLTPPSAAAPTPQPTAAPATAAASAPAHAAVPDGAHLPAPIPAAMTAPMPESVVSTPVVFEPMVFEPEITEPEIVESVAAEPEVALSEEKSTPMNAAHLNPAPLPESDAKIQQGIASALATIAHRGQFDRIGAAYIDHPARVAERFDWRNEPIHHAAAWLHSVMEDSDITERDLLEAGIRPEIVDIVQLLTRRSDVPDGDFYARINAHPIARAVKLADIADNSAAWRTRRLDAATQAEFETRYAVARTALGAMSGE